MRDVYAQLKSEQPLFVFYADFAMSDSMSAVWPENHQTSENSCKLAANHLQIICKPVEKQTMFDGNLTVTEGYGMTKHSAMITSRDFAIPRADEPLGIW